MTARVFPLREPGEIDPRAVLTGPLTGIRRVRLCAEESVTLSASGVEFSFFVLDGDGTAGTGEVDVPLRRGVSVTAPLGTELRVVAGPGGLEYFLVELEVRGES